MGHHHHSAPPDPAAISDMPGTGTGTGTGTSNGITEINPTEPIPPSADIIPASPQPLDGTQINNPNNPNNTPINDPNPTLNTAPNTAPNKDPNQNNNPNNHQNNPSQNNQNNQNQNQNNQANNNQFITIPKTNTTDQQPIPQQQQQQPKQPNDQQQQQQLPIDSTKLPNESSNKTNPVNNDNSTTANQQQNKNSTATTPNTTSTTTSTTTTPPQPPPQPTGQQQPPIDQSISRQPQSTPHHTQQNSNDSNNNTGTSVGTIMGILVAAVIGAIILAGILAMIKRRKKSKDQSDYHPELFNEKSFGYHNDAARSSLESQTAGLPISPGANRSLKPRSDPPYGPRPPSIIERHQASPAVPAPIPSYQPGQIFNYPHPPPQPFHLHRPKPPTYHNPYGDQSSDMAYANNPPIDPAPNSGAGQHNENLYNHAMHHDQNQMNLSEPRVGMNMVPCPIPYPPGAPGEQYTNYQSNNQPNISNIASYNQQQVDQLDFFGHPSPAATMIGSIPADWNSGKSYEKPFITDNNPVGPGVNVATGIALTDDQTGNKPPHPMVSNIQQSVLDGHDQGSREHEKKNLDDPIGMKEPHHHITSNLQQSYLDCPERSVQDLGLKEGDDDAYGGTEGGEGIEMNDLRTNNVTTGGITHAKTAGEGLDWKLSSPKLPSPLGDFLDDRLLGHHDPPHDHFHDQNQGADHSLYNERPKNSLKVINH